MKATYPYNQTINIGECNGKWLVEIVDHDENETTFHAFKIREEADMYLTAKRETTVSLIYQTQWQIGQITKSFRSSRKACLITSLPCASDFEYILWIVSFTSSM